MANLENLNFAVLLDDSKFTAQIQKVQDAADKFNITMTQALSLTGITSTAKKASELAKALREARDAQLEFNKAVKASPAEKITIRHRDAVSATNAKMLNTARLLRTLGTLTGGAFSVYGLRRFLSTLIEVTGQFEVQKMALRTMLQDIDAADKIFKDLYRFSSESTYRFSELAKYSKQLAAFNIGKDSLLETTKRLGDVASGVGVSMDRLILAYGHVKSSGFLRGIQLRSFSQNGVPILDELAKMFSEVENRAVSLGEVFDRMTRREIPFEMVEEAFKRMTDEGGKFYQMQEVLSKTLAGQINILKGRWENLMYAIGQSNEGFLKGAVSGISNIIADYERFGKALKGVIVAFGGYQVALISLTWATKGLAAATEVGLLRALKKIALINPYVVLAAAFAAITVEIYKLRHELTGVEQIQKVITDTEAQFTAEIARQNSELEVLYLRLNRAKKGTEEYDAAKKAIQTRYSDYISQLRAEGVAVDDLASIYDNLKNKIADATRERFLHTATEDLEKAYTNAQKQWLDEAIDQKNIFGKETGGLLGSAFKAANLGKPTAAQKEAYRSYILGLVDNIGLEDLSKKMPESNIQAVIDMINGEGDFGTHGKVRTEYIKKQLSDISDSYADGLSSITNFYENARKVAMSGNAEDEQVYKLSSIVEGIQNFDKDIKAIRDKAKKGQISASEKEQLDELVKERESQAKLYKDIMGVDYDKDTAASAKSFETATQKRIAALNKESAVLKKYKDVYDTLLPYLGESQTGTAMESLFGRKFESTDFDEQLDRIIVKLSVLGEEGQQAAESLRSSLGKETAQQLKKSLEAKDKVAEMLSGYLEKEFGIEGEGVAAKISKVLVDLTNKNIKAGHDLEKFIEELDKTEVAKKLEILSEHSGDFSALRGLGLLDDKEQEDLVNSYWEKWRSEQIKAWKERMKLEKDANKKLSDEQIVSYADDLFKSMTGGLDLTNFNDKTLSQLQAIRSELLRMTFPADIAEIINDPDTLARFSDLLDKLQGDAIKKLDLVIGDKKVQSAKRLATAFGGIGASITEMGDAMNNDVLSGVGKILSLAEEVTGVLAENETLMRSITNTSKDLGEGVDDLAKSADWITMIIKVVLIAIKQVSGAVEEDQQRIVDLIDSAREARSLLYDEQLESGVETIFGKNFVRQIQNARDNIAELDKDMAKMRTTWSASGLLWSASGSRISSASDKKTAFENTVLSERTGLFGMGRRDFSFLQAARELGFELDQIYDQYGNINKALLDAIKNTYKLDETSERLVNDLIDYGEKYDEAMDAVRQTMESIFGDVAASAADEIIEGWIEAGDAALDYADILDGVAKSYAKMLIQSAILDDVFDESHVDSLLSKFMGGDYEGAMATIADDMQKIAEMEPVFSQILTAFEPYFNRSGTADKDLANGIKGITEDTANLLASYINAVRADVSMIRLLAQQGWGDVAGIKTSLDVLPTLGDHVAQINASNAKIQEDTHKILLDLESAITSTSGRRAFAVEVQ